VTTPTNDRAIGPVERQRNVVSVEELRARESGVLDIEPTWDDTTDGDESVVLLDPIAAELAEAQRYRSAPRRHRMTADDLDRRP
jgi:hypothetical protein